MKKDDKIIINNRGKLQFGILTRKYRRKDVHYYDVNCENGSILEGLTNDKSFPVHVELELSAKFKSNKLKKHVQ